MEEPEFQAAREAGGRRADGSDVYVSPDVAQIMELHRDTIDLFPGQLTLKEYLERQAKTLCDAHREADPRVCVQVKNWHPELTGAPNTRILGTDFTMDDAALVVAREHGFSRWHDVSSVRPQRFNLDFEFAVNATVTGDLQTLGRLLDSALVRIRSLFGHRSTLLHYGAANGVETWRQTVPYNALEILRLLLESGADASAAASMFGGNQTTLALLETSGHAAAAGLSEAMAAALRDAGG